jgi:FkbM family methyltransferase
MVTPAGNPAGLLTAEIVETDSPPGSATMPPRRESWSLGNITGIPALVMPCGFTAGAPALPIGVQIYAKAFDELLYSALPRHTRLPRTGTGGVPRRTPSEKAAEYQYRLAIGRQKVSRFGPCSQPRGCARLRGMQSSENLGRGLFATVFRPARLPVTWAIQHGYVPSGVRYYLPWRWAIEPFPIYGPDSLTVRWTPIESDEVGKHLFWHGLRDWEQETVPVVVEELRRAELFLDIGANSGIYTVLGGLLNPRLRTVAFEPVQQTFAALRNNVRNNGLVSRVTALNLALGETLGEVPFHVAEDSTMSSMATEGYQGQRGQVISVECRTLDSVVDELGLKPDFMKIDVEGFEHAVLEGAHRTLQRFRPRIVLEANPGDDVERTWAILSEHGYRFENLTSQGPVVRPELAPVAEFRNWRCVPEGRD